MSYMKIDVNGREVAVGVKDAIRVGHDSQTRLAQQLVDTIVADAEMILEQLNGPDEMTERWFMTGDTMVVAHITRDRRPGLADLRVELYVCTIERSVTFSI